MKSDWYKEAYKILDKCGCGSRPAMDKGLIGYRVSCVCGAQVVEAEAIHAYIAWNKLRRGVKQ